VSSTRMWITVALLLALGALAVGGMVSAQESSTPVQNYYQYFLDRLAQVLGIDRARLDQAMKDASNQTVDRMVQDGRITQDQADWYKQRIEQGNGFPYWGKGWGRGWYRHGWGKGWKSSMIPAAAEYLGLTTRELLDELSQGKTLAQIADEKGKDKEGLRQAMLQRLKKDLDQAVADGWITQSQADSIYQQAEQADLLNNAYWGGCRGKGWWFAPPSTSQPQTQGTAL